jgi:hypothetical protein
MAMKMEEELVLLASQFAQGVEKQTEAIRAGNARLGNKYAKRYIDTLKELRTHGNSGREALVPLLKHERADVRVMTASFLLRYCTAEALSVLEAAAKMDGLAAFGASQAIKRWNEGSWNLDPS